MRKESDCYYDKQNIYPWSFETQIVLSSGDHNMFEVMTSPELLGPLGSVAFALEATLSKGLIESFLHCFLSLPSSNAYAYTSYEDTGSNDKTVLFRTE